jgi:ribosomal protein L22
MTDQKPKTIENIEVEKTEKIEAKPLPVDKEMARQIEQKGLEAATKESTKKEESSKESTNDKSSSDKKTTAPSSDIKDASPKSDTEDPSHNKDKKEIKEDKKETKDSKKDTKPKVKKYEAVVNGQSLHISKKQGVYICSFIKNKPIDKAISDLNDVINFKQAVPFKGQIPHRRTLAGSGRYPIKASKLFINLLKGLKGNVIVNGMELDNTKIAIASASWAARPMRSKRREGKRTHIILKAREFSKVNGGKK